MVGVNASENSVAISDFCEEKKQANKNNNKIQLPDVNDSLYQYLPCSS